MHSDRGAAWALSHTACPVCQALTLQKPEVQSPWEVVGFLGFKIMVVAVVAVRQAPLGPSVVCTLGCSQLFENLLKIRQEEWLSGGLGAAVSGHPDMQRAHSGAYCDNACL